MISLHDPLDPEEMLDEYAAAVGTSAATDCHGWNWKERVLQGSYRLWEARQDGARVGWIALSEHAADDAAWLSYGVWPQYRERGYRKGMVSQAAEHAFAFLGVQEVRQGVLLTNPEHLRRLFREAREGGPWQHAGAVWLPRPGYHIFMMERPVQD